jgi:hypothetical protein
MPIFCFYDGTFLQSQDNICLPCKKKILPEEDAPSLSQYLAALRNSCFDIFD